MTQSNAAFAGSIPETYHQHLGPLYFEPYAADLVKRLAPIAPGGSVLEIAAGTGIVTRRLHERLGSGVHLVATDLNDGMIQLGQKDSPGVEWRQADATSLPFEDGSFDAVVCQFGVMFFPDKSAATREAFRVLKPGGQYLFNVWDSLAQNAFSRIAHETIGGFFPDAPPDFYHTPYGYYDLERIRKLLAEAGFDDVRMDAVAMEATAPTAEHAARGLVQGTPVAIAIQERGGDFEKIVPAVADALRREGGDKPTKLPMKAFAVSARRPG